MSTTDYIWNTLHGNSKNSSSSGELLHETAELCFQKHASALDVAMVTKDGRRRLKNNFFVLKSSSFKLSESFKSVAQGVVEILEEVYLGKGAQYLPPPPSWLG